MMLTIIKNVSLCLTMCVFIILFIFIAIRSLDTLNKRIDAFRTSDVWLSSPILKQTSTTTTNNCYDQNHPTVQINCATSSSSRENNHHFKNQQQNNNNHNNNNNVQTLSSVEASVVLIQSLLADTQRQCTKMVSDCLIFGKKFIAGLFPANFARRVATQGFLLQNPCNASVHLWLRAVFSNFL